MAEVSTLPENVLREPVSRDWPLGCSELIIRCPEADTWQGMADLAVLSILLGVASLSGPLRFRAEAERGTRWRSLCPEAPRVAEELERSPEGTEERQAPYSEVYTALPQRGLPPAVLSCQDRLAEALLLKMMVLRSVTSLDFGLGRRPASWL